MKPKQQLHSVCVYPSFISKLRSAGMRAQDVEPQFGLNWRQQAPTGSEPASSRHIIIHGKQVGPDKFAVFTAIACCMHRPAYNLVIQDWINTLLYMGSAVYVVGLRPALAGPAPAFVNSQKGMHTGSGLAGVFVCLSTMPAWELSHSHFTALAYSSSQVLVQCERICLVCRPMPYHSWSQQACRGKLPCQPSGTRSLTWTP